LRFDQCLSDEANSLARLQINGQETPLPNVRETKAAIRESRKCDPGLVYV
jgi:hypothetical protein